MFDTIYIEDAVFSHPRTENILQRFPAARRILCERYGEVFNPKAQNFRLQKQRPALILAKKFKQLLLQAPPGYGIGAKKNYYFSHMLNCLYDCRYCFLQGMYRSANYVLFVNYEDFQEEIRATAEATPNQMIHFFSGYDCDSLALEPVTGFADSFLPLFRRLPNAWLELRTKSTQIRLLLDTDPLPNCIVAYSFTPDEIARALEHKTPGNQRRLDALSKLQQHGWTIGLRFDPMIYQNGYQAHYERLFATVFERIDPARLHSVSLGSFRLPDRFYRTLQKLYPEEKLFAGPLESTHGTVSYRSSLEAELSQFCTEALLHYTPEEKLFPCTL